MPASTPPNVLYYGDNLDILRRRIADDSVDLIYLDPPFKSDADNNVLFPEHSGSGAAAQVTSHVGSASRSQPKARSCLAAEFAALLSKPVSPRTSVFSRTRLWGFSQTVLKET